MTRIKHPMVAVGLLVVGVGGWMHWSAYESRANRLRITRADVERLRLADKTSELRRTIDAGRDHVRVQESKLWDAKSGAGLLDRMTRDLREIQASNASWSIGSPETIGTIDAVPHEFSFEASFDAVCRLLETMKGYPGLTRLGRIQLRRLDTQAGERLAVSLQVQALVNRGRAMQEGQQP